MCTHLIYFTHFTPDQIVYSTDSCISGQNTLYTVYIMLTASPLLIHITSLCIPPAHEKTEDHVSSVSHVFACVKRKLWANRSSYSKKKK